MRSLFAISAILTVSILMQTAVSIPVGDHEAANSTEVRDQETSLEDLCPCPKCYDPVCGSDNHTYANQCLFDCAKEHRNPNLEVQFYGDCNGNAFSIRIDDCHFADEDYSVDSGYSSKEEDSAESTEEKQEEDGADKE